MITLLEEKLNLKKYSLETPSCKKYAFQIYLNLIEEDFNEFMSYLPKSFDDLVTDISKSLNNHKFEQVQSNIDIEKKYYNISSILEIWDDITTFVKSDALLFLKLFLLYKVNLLTIISLQNKKITYSRADVRAFLEHKIQYSQSAIAKEWEIDNDTLSKWFIIQYKINPFENRKKINLSEYLSIYKDFFILKKDRDDNNTRFMISDNKLDFYNSLAIKGKTYSKRDIIEEGFDLDDKPSPKHYEEARKIIAAKFEFYSNLNKFPSSIALELIDELKKYS